MGRPTIQVWIAKSYLNAVSIRRICAADKQRIRKVVLELAIADNKKCVAEHKLRRERCQFRHALFQLNEQIVILEREKCNICPHLLYVHIHVGNFQLRGYGGNI